jgi:hypothetical protein
MAWPKWPARFGVTTGVIGSQFHRNHREPVIQPMMLRRFFARTDSASGARWASVARGNAATDGM